jgi:hypothetical protein
MGAVFKERKISFQEFVQIEAFEEAGAHFGGDVWRFCGLVVKLHGLVEGVDHDLAVLAAIHMALEFEA